MARRTLNRIVRNDALSLGIVRAIVCGVFLVSTLLTSFENLGRLPVTLLRPLGVLQFVPWSFYDALLTPAGMFFFNAALLISLGSATVGFATRISVIASLLLVTFYQGLVRSFGHFNHDEMIGIYFLLVLAFTPCGDDFAVDARRQKENPERRRSFIYGYPILLMRILLAWVYFSSALIKLRFAGLNYFDPDTLPALAIWHSLDNLHETGFRLAFYLPEYKYYIVPLVALTVVWELLFPLAIIRRRTRPYILGFGVLFHITTLFVMNITFPFQLLMYAVFVNWRQFRRRVRQTLAKVKKIRLQRNSERTERVGERETM